MKHSAKIKTQRAYVTRRNDADNALWTQQEAEVIALQEGNKEEAARRRHAAIHLKAKQRRTELKPLPASVIQALGHRDAVSNLLKPSQEDGRTIAPFLEERHGRTCLHLRDYMVRRQVHMSGGGNLVFVEGGSKSDMIDRVAALKQGAKAVEAAEATLPSKEYRAPITGLVSGHFTLRQSSGQLKGRTKRIEAELRKALKAYLEAAEPYFGKEA